MSEDFNYIPEGPQSFEQAPQKKSNKTLWIILAIVAVILLCCCLVVVLSLVLGFVSFDALDDWVYQLMPYLQLI